MLKTRILTAIVGAPVLLVSGWYGGWPFLVLVTLLALLGTFELVRLLQGYGPHLGLASAGVLILAAAAYVQGASYPGPAVTLVVILVLTASVVLYPRLSPGALCATLLAALYPGLLLYVYLLRTLPGGWEILVLALAATWAFDTFGYFVGVALGRIRITPELSPKKSLEGLIGGLAASLGVAYLFYTIAGAGPLPWLLLLGLLAGIAAQFGDLAISALKRFASVKDAGSILPGHGGILDRFDSLLISGPLVYYAIQWFGVTMP